MGSSLDRPPITPVCVCFFVLSLSILFLFSLRIYSYSLYDMIHSFIIPSVRWQLTTYPQLCTSLSVCFALSVFFSRRECPLMHCYDVLLCRVAATDSQFARRPSPMTVCFCTSLSIFFVLSQRIRFLYCYYLSVGYVLYGFLYNMYREKRIATYRNQTYTAFINERCSGA